MGDGAKEQGEQDQYVLEQSKSICIRLHPNTKLTPRRKPTVDATGGQGVQASCHASSIGTKFNTMLANRDGGRESELSNSAENENKDAFGSDHSEGCR